jgi:hypothetical protein
MSISLTVHALLQGAGLAVDRDDLSAVLGRSWSAMAVPDERNPALWPEYGQDLFLIPAARLFGLTVRAVHPPEASRGLSGVREYEQHFDASYRPIVERASEHGQAVIAWQGWDGDRPLSWGVITGVCSGGIGLEGTAIGPDDGTASRPTVPLASPPVQLYIVEVMAPTQPAPDVLLETAIAHARAVLGNRHADQYGVVTGAHAYDLWIERLRGGAVPLEVRVGVRLLAEYVAAAHWTGLRFLNRHRARLGEGGPDAVPLLTSFCQETIEGLTELVGVLAGCETPGAGQIDATVLAALDRVRETARGAHGELEALLTTR